MQDLSTQIPNMVLGYIKSFILSWVVLPTAGAIAFIMTAFSDTIGELAIKYLPFLNSLEGSYDEKDIMKLFAFASLILYIIIELLKLVGLKIEPSLKRGIILLTSIFGIVILLILYPTENLNMAGPKLEFISVFIIFWTIAIIAYSVWYSLDNLKLFQNKG